MKRLGLWVAILVAGAPVALGGGIKVGAGGAAVEVGPNGQVKVNAGGHKVNVGAGGIQVQSDGKGNKAASSSGKVYSVDGSGATVNHTCDSKHSRVVEVNGTSNVVKLKGSCDKVEVTGSSNKVVAEIVSQISVDGVGNTVSYKSGPNGRAPKVSKTGVDNSVSRSK